MTDLLRSVHTLEAVSLGEVLATAALMERTDRKYLVRRADADRLAAALAPGHRVLTVAGRRTTTYRTTYFDSDDLRSVRDHVQGRRRRFKARTRLYVEDGLCRLEVKTKTGRGDTVKVVRDIDALSQRDLDDEHHSFVAGELEAAGIDAVGALVPTIEVTYRRTTLVDTTAGTRLTIDGSLACTWNGRVVRLDDDWLIVETKSTGHAGPADLELRRLGYRPQSFSKYAAAGAAMHDDIPSNHIRRLLGQQLHLEETPA
jgi:hypothetical protein